MISPSLSLYIYIYIYVAACRRLLSHSALREVVHELVENARLRLGGLRVTQVFLSLHMP